MRIQIRIKTQMKSFLFFICSIMIITISACSQQHEVADKTKVPLPVQEKFSVILGGTTVGGMTVTRDIESIKIDFSFSNNGRGASSNEVLTLSDKGLPIDWRITGKTVFGNEVDEQFSLEGNIAKWQSSAESGNADFDNSALYIAQNASPYALYVYAKALLSEANHSMSALPSGVLTINEVDKIELKDASNIIINATIYAINGIELDPSYIALDSNHHMLGYLSPRFVVIRKGLEKQNKTLSDLAARLNA
ncbi:MAG: hypothetical protein ACI9YH_001949, partial [Colwellia sp.]